MPGRWGPEGKQAGVTITFDNLGEASDLEFGRWPIDRPVGQHHSAVRASTDPRGAGRCEGDLLC
jgi:hypothetical protein